MMVTIRSAFVSVASLLFGIAAASDAVALDKVRIGIGGVGVVFTPVEIAREKKIWEGLGLEVQTINLQGGSRVQQAFANDVVDLSVNGSPELAYRAKGIPSIAVAALAGPPYSFVIVVGQNSSLKSVGDLKGKKIAVSTSGSHSDWLMKELSRVQGWGVDGITRVPLGAPQAGVAAMQRGDVEGTVTTAAPAAEIEAQKNGRVLLSMGEYVKDTHAHLLYASDKILAQRPQVVERFIKGWFSTVAFMKANRQEGIKLASKALTIDESIVSKIYDLEMKMMIDDGTFNPAALHRVAESFVELGILDKKPDIEALHTRRFVPVKVN